MFEEDYFYTQKLSVKTTNQSELVWLTEGELSSKGGASAAVTASRKGSSLSLDKLRIKSDGRILVEASVASSATTKLTMSAEDGRQEPGKPLQSFGKLGFEMKSSKTNVVADIDVVNGPIFRSSMLHKYNSNVQLGGELVINTRFEEKDQNPEFSSDFGISYNGPGWNISSKTLDNLGTLRLSYLHQISPKLELGSQLDYRIKGNSQKISIGSKFK